MFTLEEIKEILPHREPFLMVDKVLECDPGKSAKALKAVSANEWFFQGHFAEKKVFPGVLLIECMAQTGAIAALTHEDNKGKIAFFRGLKKVKFRKMVVPGDTIEIHAEITNMKAVIGIGIAKAYVDGKLVGEGEMTFAFTDK